MEENLWASRGLEKVDFGFSILAGFFLAQVCDICEIEHVADTSISKVDFVLVNEFQELKIAQEQPILIAFSRKIGNEEKWLKAANPLRLLPMLIEFCGVFPAGLAKTEACRSGQDRGACIVQFTPS